MKTFKELTEVLEVKDLVKQMGRMREEFDRLDQMIDEDDEFKFDKKLEKSMSGLFSSIVSVRKIIKNLKRGQSLK